MKELLIVFALLCGGQALLPVPPSGHGGQARVPVLHGASDGCVSCHQGIEPMHASTVVRLTCTDCHGGNGTSKDKNVAHVPPRNPAIWKTSANPPRTYTALLRES